MKAQRGNGCLSDASLGQCLNDVLVERFLFGRRGDFNGTIDACADLLSEHHNGAFLFVLSQKEGEAALIPWLVIDIILIVISPMCAVHSSGGVCRQPPVTACERRAASSTSA